MFKRSMLTENKLLLRQEKTKELVWVPLPDFVVEAIAECDKGNEYFFYKQIGNARHYDASNDDLLPPGFEKEKASCEVLY